MTQGNFFQIERTKWEKVCSLGRMNPPVAYTVLARFSSKDNSNTRASVQAVEKYTGISRSRAKKAIVDLVDDGLVKPKKKGTFPHYELVLPPKKDLSWIWLPNEVVSGANNETPPIERVRQTHDPMCLRLFVDLYHGHSLQEDGGIRRNIIYKKYERELVFEHGEFNVWGFSPKSTWANRCDITAPHWFSSDEESNNDFFRRFNQLVDLGLVEWVPYVFDSDDDEAEPIHPYGIGLSESIEDQIGRTASSAAETLLEGCKSENYASHLLPMRRHFEKVSMFGIARLRYRPHTSATAAWWAELQEKGQRYLEFYQRLSECEKMPNRSVS